MRKIRVMIAVFWTAISCLIISDANADEIQSGNIFSNGGFEAIGNTNQSFPDAWQTSGKLTDQTPHNGQKCLKIEVTGSSAGVAQKIHLKNDTMYRFSLWYKTEPSHTGKQAIVDFATGALYPLRIHRQPWNSIYFGTGIDCRGYADDWGQLIQYFYTTTNAPEFDIGVVFNKSGGVSIAYIDDLCLEEAKPADFDGDNLLTDGGFEEGAHSLVCGVRDQKEIAKMDVAIDRTEFMQGRQSLRIELKGDNGAGLSGASIPLIPGRAYFAEGWLKSSVPSRLVSMNFDGWLPNKPHWYVSKTFIADTRWRQFSFTFKVPGEKDANYAPERKFMAPVLRVQGAGILWIDDLRLKTVSNENTSDK